MVIGIADATEYASTREGPGQENADLNRSVPATGRKEELGSVAEQFLEQYPRILLSQLLVIDCAADKGDDWVPEGAICIPPHETFKSTVMKTIMCDISAKLLSEMTTYAKAVQALPSIQSPGASSSAAQNRPTLDRHSSIRDSSPKAESPAGVKAAPSDAIPPGPDSRPGTPLTTIKSGPPTSFDEIASATTPGVLSRSTSRAGDNGRTASRDRMSVQAFTGTSAAERVKNKGKARVGIVIGNLYMMAGRWSDAWRELNENTNKSRVASDHLWYAKGLESLITCMLLFVWAGFDFNIPPICQVRSDRPISLLQVNGIRDLVFGSQDPAAARQAAGSFAKLLPELVPTILSAYEKAPTLSGEALSPVAYSETVLRLSNLLAVLHNADGLLDPSVLQKVVSGRVAFLYKPKPDSGFTSGISKHAVAEILLQAYPPPNSGVPLAEMVKILCGIVSTLSKLGLERKKAIVLKELMAYLVPALVQARKVGAAEMGIHPAASLTAAFVANDPLGSSGDQQNGLDEVMRDLHLVYGALTKVEPQLEKQDDVTVRRATGLEDLVNAIIIAAIQSAETQSFGSLHLKIDILRSCIDFCEALPDLSGLVHFAALLLRVAGPQSAMDLYDRQRRVRLATEEQIRLMSNMSRTINAATKIGLPDIQAPYWDDFLVRDLQWLEGGTTKSLREHQSSDLEVESQHRKSKTPFLYDPFAKPAETKMKDNIVVAGEPVELVISLQNPYSFDVQVEKLSLVTEGVGLDIEHAPLTLGPVRVQNIVLTATASEVGDLKIVGCLIKIFGCTEQKFPIYQSTWTAEAPLKVKNIGLPRVDETHSTAKPLKGPQLARSSKQSSPLPHSLSMTVIQAQPQVIVDSIGLAESALMILEGQTKTFQVTLQNTSSTTTVDFLHISFRDSLTTSIQTALASKELSRAEAYELELQLSLEPAFTWNKADGSEDLIILPGEKAVFDFHVFGKPGLGAATIMFDYANLGKPSSQIEGRTFTRQVSAPIDITVNASVQLHRVDLAEFPMNFSWSNQHQHRLGNGDDNARSRRTSTRPVEKSSDRFRTLLDRVGVESEDEEHCLVLLDLRNAWPSPLTVSVDVREGLSPDTLTSSPNESESWKRAYTVHEVIHPGHIARLVLLLPKIYVANPYAPIPLLSQQNQRQFIVSADKKLSAETERTTREHFWFREELLKHIRGSWKEEGSSRHGAIALRSLRLNSRMIENIRLQDVDVTMTCAPADTGDSDAVTQLAASRFHVSPETFLTLKTTVRNRSDTPVRAVLRLSPSLANQTSMELALDIGKRIMWSGLLQQALPIIPPGESVEAELGVCALVCGDFDIGAVLEEMVVPAGEGREEQADAEEDFEAGRGGLRRKERRIWRAREALRIHVVETS